MDGRERQLFLRSIVGLAVVALGIIVVCLMKYYAGIIIIIPAAIPHASRFISGLKKLRAEKKK